MAPCEGWTNTPLTKKRRLSQAFGGVDSQHKMRRQCLQPSLIRTIPSAPASHRILLTRRRTRGLDGSVRDCLITDRPWSVTDHHTAGRELSHLCEIHPAPKVFPIRLRALYLIVRKMSKYSLSPGALRYGGTGILNPVEGCQCLQNECPPQSQGNASARWLDMPP